MSVDTIINGLVAAGTLGLASVTYLSLRELKKQRLSNYIPHFTAYETVPQAYVVGTNFDILIKNFGPGVAKDVHVTISDLDGKNDATFDFDYLDNMKEQRIKMLESDIYREGKCVIGISYTDLLGRKYPDIKKVLEITQRV